MFVFAHRGASALSPENTLVAFKKAIELGAKGIELDVQLSKDGVVMVMHDDTLDRTTNGKGRLEKFNLEELKKLDSGFWYDKSYCEEKIPTLEEVIKILPENVRLNIEFKPDKKNVSKIAQEVYKILERYNCSEQVIISSFYHHSLLEYRKLDENIQMGMLFEYDIINIFEYIKKSGINPVSINISKDYIDENLIKEAHENNLKIAIYTVNEYNEAMELKKIGIDEIFSNYPCILNKE
ncbi:MAG: glycerophosphodiester phosphodiesterase [Fusobacteriaceae bacterium]